MNPREQEPGLGFWTVFGRCCRLRCPRCGEGRLFRGLLHMNAVCEHCALRIEREPGFYLGSIYFNYGLTSVIGLATFFALYFGYGISPDAQLWPMAVFCVVFPLFFFRHARALWLGMDVYLDRENQSSGGSAEKQKAS